MIKVMLFVKRKDGLTREQFRERYEAGHVPLAVKELQHVRRYHRSYVKPARGLPDPDFDVCTMDRASMRFVVVEECVAEIDAMRAAMRSGIGG